MSLKDEVGEIYTVNYQFIFPELWYRFIGKHYNCLLHTVLKRILCLAHAIVYTDLNDQINMTLLNTIPFQYIGEVSHFYLSKSS